MRSSPTSPTTSPRRTTSGTPSRWTRCGVPARPVGTCQASGTRCTSRATRARPSSSASRTRRACVVRTCGSSRPWAACTSRSSVAASRSTAPASVEPHWRTSDSRSSCCVASPCWRVRRASSARSPRSGVDRSVWTPTSSSTATRSTSTRSPDSPKETSMAQVVAVIASTHHPFYYRASTAVGEDRPRFADEWVAKIERFRETLTRAEPDVLVMVGSDHFHQLWLDNMPQFLVGKAPFFDANWHNEEREFGLPRMTLPGEEKLAAHILRDGLDAGFDLAFSNELRIDHSITCPIITLRPENDLPIVPVYTNIFAPPLPQPKRFVQLGKLLRELVEAWPSDKRVAIIGTGHLSLELGGPRQFGPHGPDPDFDRKAVDWIARGDLEG